MVGPEKMDKQMKHRSKAEDVLITKIIKMLLLTLSMLNYLLSTCSRYSVDQKCSRVKELQQGRGRTLRKGKLQNAFSIGHKRTTGLLILG